MKLTRLLLVLLAAQFVKLLLIALALIALFLLWTWSCEERLSRNQANWEEMHSEAITQSIPSPPRASDKD